MSWATRLLQPETKPYDTGSVSPDTDDASQDFPQLTTFSRKGTQINIEQHTIAFLPDEITLRLKLVPIRLSKRLVSAKIIVEGRVLKPCTFYEPDSIQRVNRDIFECVQWAGIDLIFEGTAYYKTRGEKFHLSPSTHTLFEMGVKAGECLFPYRFILPERDSYIQEQTSYRRQNWMVNLPPYAQGMNIIPLIPYAGFIADTLDITRICQAYALIVDIDVTLTHLGIYTQRYCHSKGIKLSSPEFETRYKLCADQRHLPTISLSLAGWLTAGHLHLPLKCAGSDTFQTYRSRNYAQVDPALDTIDVVFTR